MIKKSILFSLFLFNFFFGVSVVMASIGDYSFDGWEAGPGKITVDGKEVWPHEEKTVDFQNAYNKALAEAKKNDKCTDKVDLDTDSKYGDLTHEARVFVSSGEFAKTCEKVPEENPKTTEEHTILLPPVTNGNVLPGPKPKEDARDYVMKKFLPGITNWLLVIISTVSVLMVVIAGMFYIFSSGDSEQLNRGKDILVWTILGFTISVLGYAIVKLIINISFF